MTYEEIRTQLHAAAARSTKLPPATEKQIEFLASLFDKCMQHSKLSRENAEFTLKRIKTDTYGLTLRGASNHIESSKLQLSGVLK